MVESWLLQSGNAAFATAAGLTAPGKVAVGVASGFTSGFVGSGGDVKAGLQAGLTGGAFGYAGTVGAAASDPSRYFAHAVAGCLSSALGGGDCDEGAASALAGKYVTNNTPLSWGGSTGLAAATVAGGTVSVITGGKFGNGAVTAAFGYLYNQALSRSAASAGLARGAAGANSCHSAECQLGMIDHQAGAAAKLTSAWDKFWGGAYDLIFNDGDVAPSTPTGQRGSPLDVAPGSNKPTNIGGRDYSGHALDRMQGRGVPPSAVEDAIQNGARTPGNRPSTDVYTGSNGVTVVTGDGGRVVTVITR